MKKTFISLLAFSSVAFGLSSSELNTQLANDLTTQGYQVGDAFTITLTDINEIGSSQFDKFLTLTETYSIGNQEDTFVSINAGSTSNAWLSASDYTVDTTNKTASITLAASDITGKGYWFVGRFAGNPVTFHANGSARPDEVTAITLSYSTDKTTSIIVTRTDNSVHTLNITNLELDAKAISFTHNRTSIGNMTVTVIPEPTTATLSLLALAGLAARRRRK